jgi:carboxynorspermidine decarboxylase
VNLDKSVLDQIPTPCFVLEEKALLQNLNVIKRLRSEANVKVILALKGFAMQLAFPIMRPFLDGATASSLNEAQLAEDFGKEVHVYAPAYSNREIKSLLDKATAITFNSISQYEKFHKQAAANQVPIGFRVNPGYSEIDTPLYDPCAPGSRLGILPEELKHGLPNGVTGLHFHALCEGSAGTLEKTIDSLEKHFKPILKEITWLNLGGGHAFTREGYDLDKTIGLINRLKETYPNIKEFVFEPGSAIGWNCGWLVSEVLDVIERDGSNIAMLDTSFAAHMPDTLEMPYKPVLEGEVAEGEGVPYRLGGLTCLAGDQMDGFHVKEALKVGDKVAFRDMMHYTMVKTNTFNGVNLPSLGVLRTDGSFDLRTEFGYQDFRGRL